MDYTSPKRRGVYRREKGAVTQVEIDRHPWGFECERPDCQLILSAPTEEAARLIEATHTCPYYGGKTTYGWSITVTLVEEVWQKLDADMMSLMQPEAGTDFVSLKARLRAFAEVLAIFMKPHFTTADEIAREARRRYDNRLDPEYCTAGLEQRRFEPPPGSRRLSEETWSPGTRTATRATAQSAVEKGLSKLTDEQKTSIKLFHDNQFPVAVLAKSHGVSEAVINAVLQG